MMFVNTEIYSEPINGHTSWQNVQYSDSVTKTAAFLYFINFIHILQPRKTQSSDLFVVTEYTCPLASCSPLCALINYLNYI